MIEPTENAGPAPSAADHEAPSSAADHEARRAVTSLLEQARAFASASSDEALTACSDQLSKLIDELAQGKRAVRQQGSQARAHAVHAYAHHTTRKIALPILPVHRRRRRRRRTVHRRRG